MHEYRSDRAGPYPRAGKKDLTFQESGIIV